MNIKLENLTETQRKLVEVSKFLIKLLIAGAVFRIILFTYPDTTYIQAMFADIIGLTLQSSGFNPTVEGISIIISAQEYIITQDCLGWKSVAAFLGLMYASTDRTLTNLNFLVKGILIIGIANFIRVYSTLILAEKGIITFSIIHDILWSWSLTLIVLAIWGYWLVKIKPQKPLYRQKIDERIAEIKEN